MKTYEVPKFNARDNLADLLFDGNTEDLLKGQKEEKIDLNMKKYKNSALKPYKGSSHSKKNRIKLQKLTRSDYGSLTSKRDGRGNFNLVQKDNFGIKELEGAQETIDVTDAAEDSKNKASGRKLDTIREEGGAVVTSRSKVDGKFMALDHFNGRRKLPIPLFTKLTNF